MGQFQLMGQHVWIVLQDFISTHYAHQAHQAHLVLNVKQEHIH